MKNRRIIGFMSRAIAGALLLPIIAVAYFVMLRHLIPQFAPFAGIRFDFKCIVASFMIFWIPAAIFGLITAACLQWVGRHRSRVWLTAYPFITALFGGIIPLTYILAGIPANEWSENAIVICRQFLPAGGVAGATVGLILLGTLKFGPTRQ